MGSFGWASYDLGRRRIEDVSDDGFAFQLGAVKEWWISSEWGFREGDAFPNHVTKKTLLRRVFFQWSIQNSNL